jgi:hypothetical protein
MSISRKPHCSARRQQLMFEVIFHVYLLDPAALASAAVENLGCSSSDRLRFIDG